MSTVTSFTATLFDGGVSDRGKNTSGQIVGGSGGATVQIFERRVDGIFSLLCAAGDGDGQ